MTLSGNSLAPVSTIRSFKMFKHSSLAPPRAFPKARVAPAYREGSGLIMSPKAAIRVVDVLVGVNRLAS